MAGSIEQGAAHTASQLPKVAAHVVREAAAVRDELVPRVSEPFVGGDSCLPVSFLIEAEVVSCTSLFTSSWCEGQTWRMAQVAVCLQQVLTPMSPPESMLPMGA